VGDEQVGQAQARLEISQQGDDTGSDRDIEGGHGLIEDYELRIQGQGPGDGYPLTLATRELMRVAGTFLGPEAHLFQQLRHPPPPTAPVAAVNPEGFGDDVVYPELRVERGERVLEHDLEIPTSVTNGPSGDRRQLHVHEPHPARRGPLELENGASGGGLARAGFADQAERLPGAKVEGDVADGVNVADLASQQPRAAQGEVLDEILDLQQGLGAGPLGEAGHGDYASLGRTPGTSSPEQWQAA